MRNRRKEKTAKMGRNHLEDSRVEGRNSSIDNKMVKSIFYWISEEEHVGETSHFPGENRIPKEVNWK